MPKFDFYPSFNAGEVSPFIDARTTLEKYRSACRVLENFQILPYGGAVRRPGLRHVGETKRSATRCRLVGFNFSTTTRFILEVGVGYIRFWRGTDSGGQQILNPVSGFPLEVVTPYDEECLRELQFAQINDIMYFAHARYPVFKLSRLADDNWAFGEVNWFYPPLRDVNIESTAISANDTTGTVTLTASSAIFQQGHVGSQWRLEWPRTITSSNIEINISAAHNVSNTIDVKGAWDLTTYGTWDATIQILRTPPDVWQAGPVNKAVSRVYPQAGTEATVTHTAHGFTTGDLVFFSNAGAPFDLTASPAAITVVDANSYKYAVANSGPTSSSVLRVAKQDSVAKSVSRSTTLATVTHTAHGFATGDLVYFSDSVAPFNTTGAVAITFVSANSYRYTVPNSGATTGTVKIAKVEATDRSVSRVYPQPGTVATVTHTGHGFSNNDRVHFNGSVAPFNTTEAVLITVIDADSYSYTVANSGASTGTVRVENISQMEIVREYDSNADRNIITSGTELERCGIKIYVKAWASQTNARATLTVANQVVGGQVKIATVAANGLTATAAVEEWLGADAAGSRKTKLWYEAAFSGSRGYPRAVSLHEQRLCFGGTSSAPNTLWCSAIDDFENFETGPQADNAVSFTLAASEGNRINWLYSQADLLVGTSGDEWTVGSADTAQALSASNIQANRQSSYGSKYMRASLVNDVLLFVQRNGRKVRELVYELNKDGWIAPDLTLLAEHITKGEIVEVAYQQQPDAILWCVRGDGVLLGMTYERDQKVVGWHRHITDGTVESAAVIYGIGTEDELWVAVNRVVDGAVKRFLERFQLRWREHLDNEAVNEWRYLDNYVNSPPNEFAVQSVTLISSGTKLEVVLDQDSFTLELLEGDLVTFRNVGGTTQLNGTFRIKADPLDASQWILANPVTGANIDATGWGTYTTGGLAAFEAAYPIQSITAAPLGSATYPAITVSGLGATAYNGEYTLDGTANGFPRWVKSGVASITGNPGITGAPNAMWVLQDLSNGDNFIADGPGSEAAFPWLVPAYENQGIDPAGLTWGRPTLQLILSDVLFDTDFTNNAPIRFESVAGMTQLNGTWKVRPTDDPDYFELIDPATDQPANATSWSAYTSGGYAVLSRAFSVPNLSGREVVVYDDAGVWSSQLATRGRVNRLNQPLAVGLPYTSTLRPMKLDMELQDGTSQGRKKRVHQILARTYKSRGGEIRTNGGEYYDLARTGVNTGDQKIVLAGAFGLDADLDVRQTEPFPLALLALEPKWDAYGNE